MRYLALILALAAAILLTGCSSLISLNPFVADASTTTDPALKRQETEEATGAKRDRGVERCRTAIDAV